MTLYKATRPDGTDFRTRTVDYGQALRVTAEVEAHQALGPNGAQVAALIERAAAGAAAWAAAWDAAWDAARAAAWDVGRAAQALLVRDLITPQQFQALYGPWAAVMEPAS